MLLVPSCIKTYQRQDTTTIPSRPPDYLSILSLGPDASDQEITQAWRRAVLAYHPDRKGVGPSPLSPSLPKYGGPGSSGQKDIGGDDGPEEVDIRLINEARWVLGDAERRKAWEEEYRRK